MDKAEALTALKSADIHERLTAARFLSHNAEREDISTLQSALASEKIGWVSRALSRAIQRATANSPEENVKDFGKPVEDSYNETRARAVEEVAGIILHELTPVLGLVRAYASSEMGDHYPNSKTRSSLDDLNSLMDCIRTLKTAASQPRMAECDLNALVARVIASLDPSQQSCISIANEGPFLVTVDEAHMFIAIVNGLRNAVEAAVSNSDVGTADPIVVVNWGRGGEEDWLAVIDNGPGFQQAPERMIRMGTTLKKAGHFGFGLALVQQAITAMEGSLSLTNSSTGGAIFELRWLRK